MCAAASEPSSAMDACPHWKLGSPSLEINILLSGECGIAAGDTVGAVDIAL